MCTNLLTLNVSKKKWSFQFCELKISEVNNRSEGWNNNGRLKQFSKNNIGYYLLHVTLLKLDSKSNHIGMFLLKSPGFPKLLANLLILKSIENCKINLRTDMFVFQSHC